LFDAAARFTARLPHGSPRLFLDSLSGQEIAGDTLAARAPQGDAVAVLTAHRAKGLEWDLVVVAGVQEGIWPDIRVRGSLLGMDEMVQSVAGGADLGAAGAGSGTARAGSGVGGGDSEDRPSRFLAELAGDEIETEHVTSAGQRWLSLPALTADLRRAAA